MVLPVEYKIRIIHDGQVVEPSDYSKIVIVNQIVDRIVNEIYEHGADGPEAENG